MPFMIDYHGDFCARSAGGPEQKIEQAPKRCLRITSQQGSCVPGRALCEQPNWLTWVLKRRSSTAQCLAALLPVLSVRLVLRQPQTAQNSTSLDSERGTVWRLDSMSQNDLKMHYCALFWGSEKHCIIHKVRTTSCKGYGKVTKWSIYRGSGVPGD